MCATQNQKHPSCTNTLVHLMHVKWKLLISMKIYGADTGRLQHAALWLHMNHSMIIWLLNLSQISLTHSQTHTHTQSTVGRTWRAPNSRATETWKEWDHSCFSHTFTLKFQSRRCMHIRSSMFCRWRQQNNIYDTTCLIDCFLKKHKKMSLNEKTKEKRDQTWWRSKA